MISEIINDNEKLLSANDVKQQNSEPIRVTATSSNCLYHLITSFQVQTETIPTTIKDQFTVFAEILPLTNEPKHQPSFWKSRDVSGMEANKALTFLYLLDQKTV